MEILVTGGAGYIGSAAHAALIKQGHGVVVVDNLSKGRHELVHPSAELYQVDLVDQEALTGVFRDHPFDAVMHFAAYKSVPESMRDPNKYKDNVVGTNNLLRLMADYSVGKLIFSSTAAVYGTPKYIPVDETHPTDPINVYGETKLACERNIEDVCTEAGIGHVSLRYFNVAGDAGLGYVDPHAENVIPIMMEVAFGEGDKFTILGDDYGTPDGTAVRDYIDIDDLVRAHILALDSDFNGVINLGSSEGISVLDLVKVTEEVTGRQVNYEFGPRREGDPSRVVASNELAQRELGWEPEKGISEMLRSTFEAYKRKFENPSQIAT